MIGLTPTDTRELLETNLDIVVRLLAGETVTAKTATHELFDAQLQLAPYADGGIPLAVAAVASPTGARLAGKHGIGLLSIGATLIVEGFDALAHHWGIAEERAAAFGTTVDRKNWSLVGPFTSPRPTSRHAPTSASASNRGSGYFQKVAAFPQMTMPGDQIDEMIDIINDVGRRRHRHARAGAGRRCSGCGTSPAGSAACCRWVTSGPIRRRPSAPRNCLQQKSFRTSRVRRNRRWTPPREPARCARAWPRSR